MAVHELIGLQSQKRLCSRYSEITHYESTVQQLWDVLCGANLSLRIK